METTRTTKAWNPSSIMLFREDLEEILKIFRTVALATTKISDEADLTFYRAKEFLEVRRRPSQYWFGTVLPAVCISVPLFSVVLYLHRGDTPPLRPWIMLLNVLDALAVLGLIVGPMLKYGFSYLVTLKREREAASFFKRNRDRFLMSLLFFGLGIVVTLIVQYFK